MYLREALENVRKLKESVDLEIKENRNDKNKTEEEKANFKPSTDPHTINLMEQMILNLGGNYSKGRASIKESLTTTDAVKLIPKIIEGKLLEASEPAYLGTNFFQTIHVDGGNSAVYVILPKDLHVGSIVSTLAIDTSISLCPHIEQVLK